MKAQYRTLSLEKGEMMIEGNYKPNNEYPNSRDARL
jgi:hypothetical protein